MALKGAYRQLTARSGKRAARRACAPALGLVPMLLLVLSLSLPAAAMEQRAHVLMIASQRSGPYTEFVSLIRQRLDAINPLTVSTDVRFADELSESGIAGATPRYDLVVTIGTRAAHALHDWQLQTPVVYTLIPEITFSELKQSGQLPCYRENCTAVYIDQPLERQLHVLHAAFGERRVGVLFGPASVHYQASFEEAAERHGLPVVTRVLDEDQQLLPALREILQEAGVLLALPDPLVYNSRSAQSILLTTYRYKVPMMAFSRAYIDAGATLSIYSTPRDMAAQAGRIVSEFLRGDRKQLPPPAYPRDFRVRVNRHVARSIDLDFEDNPEFLSIMKQRNDE